jgi:hypothetical protein
MAPGFGLPPQSLQALANSVRVRWAAGLCKAHLQTNQPSTTSHPINITTPNCTQSHAPAVRLWIGVAAVDYQALAARLMAPGMTQAQLGEAIVASGAMGEAVEGVRAAAEARGFRARKTGWGRCLGAGCAELANQPLVALPNAPFQLPTTRTQYDPPPQQTQAASPTCTSWHTAPPACCSTT